jgi:hypothetical protein
VSAFKLKTYIHPHVQIVREFQNEVLSGENKYEALQEFLICYAQNLKLGFQEREKAVSIDISNYYKPLIGKDEESIFSKELSDVQFLDIAASVHGFENFSVARQKDQDINTEFEHAVDIMLSGNITKLESLLNQNPELTKMHSCFGHDAQLIHYCASNAVEIYRQIVPLNLLDIIKLLIANGADPEAKIPVYEGHFDFMALFETSGHPREAGIYEEVVKYFNVQ